MDALVPAFALSQFLIVSPHLLNVKTPPSTARLIATSADTPNWRALLHDAQVCQRYREEIHLASIGQTKNALVAHRPKLCKCRE